MALSNQYVIASGLQELFVDKLTGLPLVHGVVTFYQDDARTIMQPIYELTGSAPNYTYTPLPNPLTLSSVGTIQDALGNDIVPYYKVYDANGNILPLYYITVYSQLAVLQFTREGWPNIVAKVTPQILEQENYIPNGQFLVHSTTDDGKTADLGLITVDNTEVSQGGWWYYRGTSSTATDYVNFGLFGGAITNPTGNPLNFARIKCNIVNPSDTFKYFGITFNDVNKFTTSDVSTPVIFTFAFYARSNTGSSISIPVVVDQYYGVGGSTEVITPQGASLVITTSWQLFKVNVDFGYNVGKTIGSGNSVSLLLSLPPTAIFDISTTDWMMFQGANIAVTQYPYTTNLAMQTQALVPAIPDQYGNDLYLPLMLTPDGLAYDHTVVGKVMPCVNATPGIGELLCDGATYKYYHYSTDKIPYSRLGKVLFNNSTSIPQFGTGSEFVTCFTLTPGTDISISQNNPGTATAITNGSPSPALVITPQVTGLTTNVYAGYNGISAVQIINILPGASAFAPSAGTTGWSAPVVSRPGTSTIQEVIQFTVGAVGSSLASKYISYANTSVHFCLWFKVNGIGTQPALGIGYTYIDVDILSTHTVAQVARIVGQAASGFKVQRVTFPAATSISAGSYFNLYTQAGNHWVFYYTVNGVGTLPVVPGAEIVAIPILSSYTATDVANLTRLHINKSCYATPDLRGDFIRIWDNGKHDDLYASTNRFSWLNGPAGDAIGSFENFMVESHTHGVNYFASQLSLAGGSNAGCWNGAGSNVTTAYGGYETRPINFNVNAIIKY